MINQPVLKVLCEKKRFANVRVKRERLCYLIGKKTMINHCYVTCKLCMIMHDITHTHILKEGNMAARVDVVKQCGPLNLMGQSSERRLLRATLFHYWEGVCLQELL